MHPCRIGSTRGMEVVDRLIASTDMAEREDQALLLRDLCDTLQYGSLRHGRDDLVSGGQCPQVFPC